jgi:hypothetical protein
MRVARCAQAHTCLCKVWTVVERGAKMSRVGHEHRLDSGPEFVDSGYIARIAFSL